MTSGSGKCLYLAERILDFELGQTAYTPPTDLYVAMSSAVFSRATTGATLLSSEPTGGGYARIHFVNDGTVWPLAADAGDGTAQKANLVDLAFPDVTASLGYVLSVYILDGGAMSSADNCLWGFDVPMTLVDVGPGPIFVAGALVMKEI
jgi:hypothetical protein